MPNILCIETSIGKCSVALNDDLIEADKMFMQSEVLLPLMQEILERNHLDYKDLDIIACSLGPGSFTGIRIGIAAARGVTKIFPDIKLLGVSTLELMVNELPLSADKQILAVLNASGGDLYAQDFRSDGTVLCDIYLIPQKELEAKRKERLLITEQSSFIHPASLSVNITARTLFRKVNSIILEEKQSYYKNIWPIYMKEPNITVQRS
jgi:tRNA threonylcarbamoyl adenosine modification protein YeaZ